ncbi:MULTISPECIES: PQQ-binding-like beta-propeller repeat protein [unclassified Streptomyces]|uniref:serine/threonine-protein kinase n=1 Tax=unclassified Streptomyces TaxID=2593676 RepID=UPI003650DB54
MHSRRADYAGFPEYAGQYRLESVLGSGGMGVVHLAASSSGLKLAVKVVHAQHAVDPEFRARFRQEVAAARRVSGAFTAPVVDADPDAERPWMATLFVDAPTLSERVRERVLDSIELTRLAAGLAEALRDIHRAGVVHRDLKPSNVLMAPDGVRVIDFGISRPADSDLRTETGKLIGTPPFMAPEQFQSPRDVGTAADVFALGAVLVYAATGHGPFDSDSHYLVAYQVVHSEPDLTGLPALLVPVVARCLAKDPNERPTAHALIAEIRALTSPTSENTQSFIAQPRIPRQRKPAPDEEDTHRRAVPAVVRRPARPPRGWALRAWVAAALLAVGAVGGGLWLAADAGTPVRNASEAPGDETAVPPPVTPWSVSLGGHTASCSAVGAALYCAGRHLTGARLNVTNGAVAWSVPAPASGALPGATPPVPREAGGVIVVVADGGERLRALDPKTGAERWQRGLSAGTQVVTAGPHVLLTSADGSVRAIDAADGAQRWTGPGAAGSGWWGGTGQNGAPSFFRSTPDGSGRSTEVSEVDASTGTVRWQVRTDGRLRPFGTAADTLFLLDNDASAHAIGVVRIGRTTRSVQRVRLSAPLYDAQATVGANGTTYAFGTQGTVAAVGTGKELWRLETGAASASSPMYADGHVYLSVSDGRLLAVDAATGRLVGQTGTRLAAGRAAVSSAIPAPVLSDGRVYASAPDGTVFAVDAANPAGW